MIQMTMGTQWPVKFEFSTVSITFFSTHIWVHIIPFSALGRKMYHAAFQKTLQITCNM